MCNFRYKYQTFCNQTRLYIFIIKIAKIVFIDLVQFHDIRDSDTNVVVKRYLVN